MPSIRRIRPCPEGSFENDRRIEFALHVLAEAIPDHRLAPTQEDVDIAGVIHQLYGPCPGRTGADLAENRLTVVF